jgi:DNA helicase-2/ATP-dependent DNA helicase PcrA
MFTLDLDANRQFALKSNAKARLITGSPGVGKTYFGCQIAEYELRTQTRGLKAYQKILFLTFARKAVARIRQAYLQHISANIKLTEMEKAKRRSQFYSRIDINTFAGFFWWLVESYGRYAPGVSHLRSWFIGTKRMGGERIPVGYIGYTFEELEQIALSVLEISAIRRLLSELYPIIVIDEYQDVHERLFEIIVHLGDMSQLVLLRGPGQCIYGSMKNFDPENILKMTIDLFQPKIFQISPLSQQEQRCCPEIVSFLSQYDKGHISQTDGIRIRLKPIPRFAKKGYPNKLEIHSGLMVKEIRQFLRLLNPEKPPSIAVLASTNNAVAAIHRSLIGGSQSYNLPKMAASLTFKDTLLLHYGRLVFELLPNHWIARIKKPIEIEFVVTALTALFQDVEEDRASPSDWLPLALGIVKMIENQQHPSAGTSPLNKLRNDLESVNKLLRAKKNKLPPGSPRTPLTKDDIPLLIILREKFLDLIEKRSQSYGRLDIGKVKRDFENLVQQEVLYEKLGIEEAIQVMTIHKAKGREFDGVVLVLESGHKALWRKDSHTSNQELEDLYRVAISRGRDAFGLVAYDDIFSDAKPPVQTLLTKNLFSAS